METADLIAVGLIVMGYALFSARLEGTSITPPMAFIAAGVVLGALGRLDVAIDDGLVTAVMEATLVVVLFTDASRIDLSQLRADFRWPLRMLSFGLLATIGLGALAALALFGDLGLWEATVLAVVLAPTDAALGQAVVSDPAVPVSVRQTLNVESGLNDGLALPLLTIALAFAGTAEATNSAGFWTTFAVRQIGVALLVGVTAGWLTAVAVRWSRSRGWMSTVFLKLAGLTTAFVAFGLAVMWDSSGFIAAFVAGAVLGNLARTECEPIHEFAETEGQLLVLITFLLFGALAVADSFERLTWQIVVYAILSLTVVRMLPVAASLVGSKLRASTTWFLAWFGPRGLASILFGLLVLEEAGMGGETLVFDVVVVTVTLSALLHGVTAAPLARRYAASVGDATDDMPEMMEVAELPTRVRYDR